MINAVHGNQHTFLSSAFQPFPQIRGITGYTFTSFSKLHTMNFLQPTLQNCSLTTTILLQYPVPHVLALYYSSSTSSQGTNFYFSQSVWTARKKVPKSQLNITVAYFLLPLRHRLSGEGAAMIHASVACSRRKRITWLVMSPYVLCCKVLLNPPWCFSIDFFCPSTLEIIICYSLIIYSHLF